MKKNLEPLKDALEELADFARKMEPTEYAYFYRLMELHGEQCGNLYFSER